MTALARVLLAAAATWLSVTTGWVVLYRFVDPPVTFLMLRDWTEGQTVRRDWRALDELPASIKRAVIAAEDSDFCSHGGFDLAAIQAAIERNERSDRLRGGSTISQQTAKNVFLWPGRTWLRKGLEAYFTALVELIWGKARILEVYLNVVELGRGVFGVEAAARHYFGKAASRLASAEAARLAAILPQPIKRTAASPGPYTRRYARQIERRMRVVARDGLAACVAA